MPGALHQPLWMSASRSRGDHRVPSLADPGQVGSDLPGSLRIRSGSSSGRSTDVLSGWHGPCNASLCTIRVSPHLSLDNARAEGKWTSSCPLHPSGKSTAILALLGFIPITGGSLRIDGTDIRRVGGDLGLWGGRCCGTRRVQGQYRAGVKVSDWLFAFSSPVGFHFQSCVCVCMFELLQFSHTSTLLPKVPLSTLRESIAVVPQDAVVFHGSFRKNLDPKGMNTGASIRVPQTCGVHRCLCSPLSALVGASVALCRLPCLVSQQAPASIHPLRPLPPCTGLRTDVEISYALSLVRLQSAVDDAGGLDAQVVSACFGGWSSGDCY